MKFLRHLAFAAVFAAFAALGCGPALASADAGDSAVTKDTYKIIIDQETQIFTVLGRDDEGAYTVVLRQMPCSTGKAGQDTPTGTFTIGTKARWLSSKKYGTYEQYASRVVGSIWIHSTVFTKKSPNALVRSSYAKLGRPVSMGCIRLCVGDAKWVYNNCPAGTAVQIVKSGGPEAICLEILPALPKRGNFDPTDPAVVKDPAVRVAVTENMAPIAPDDLFGLIAARSTR